MAGPIFNLVRFLVLVALATTPSVEAQNFCDVASVNEIGTCGCDSQVGD